MCGEVFLFFDLYCLLSYNYKNFQKKHPKNLTLTNTIRTFTKVKNSDWVVRNAHP